MLQWAGDCLGLLRFADAVAANLQIMFDTTCCDGPCSNPASGGKGQDACSDCGVCCSANLDCEATCVPVRRSSSPTAPPASLCLWIVMSVSGILSMSCTGAQGVPNPKCTAGLGRGAIVSPSFPFHKLYGGSRGP